MKIIFRGLLICLLFFSTWFLLSRVDWVALFHVEEVSSKTEQKLGDLFWKMYSAQENENTNEAVQTAIDSMVTKICIANKLERFDYKIHVFNKDEVNAFALPDKHLVIYSGLIKASANQEELIGVICHEMAHCELNHVMKKLIKEIGLGVLISITTNGNGDMLREALKVLSSTAFDRDLEREADIKAVEYLNNTGVSAEPFANFLYNLSLKDNDVNTYLSWLSTHPDSKERAEYILKHNDKDSLISPPLIQESTWVLLRNELN